MKIAIIGAGIIGLSSGVRILEAFPGADVIVYGEDLPPHTTGDVAAGLWKPYAVDVSDLRLRKWCELTFEFLKDMIRCDPNHHKNGVYEQIIHEITQNNNIERSFFYDIIEQYRELTAKELKKFDNAKFGLAYTSVMCEGTKIIAYILKRFMGLGGKIKQMKINTFDQIQSIENYSVVLICAGVGSGQICGDSSTYPIRGQVVQVEAPWLKFGVMDNTHYIFPQSDGNVILGGTKQKDNWDLTISETDNEDILKHCYKLMPGLKTCRIVGSRVGLRPGRVQVRLRMEEKRNSSTGAKYKVVYNYGHGGAGLTMFWGCAFEVVELLKNNHLRARL